MTQKQLGQAVIIGIVFNVILTILKLTFGYIGHSHALITDGYNSLSDIITSMMIFLVLKISTKKPDHDHPYGHQKFEGIAYFALGMIFLLSALVLLISTATTFVTYLKDQALGVEPTLLTLYMAIISLVIKLFLAMFYRTLYKKTNHPTLKAESSNHGIDMIATTFTIVGIGLSQLGFIIFDYIAAILIVFLILRLAINTLKESIPFLVDQAPDQLFIDEMMQFIIDTQGVLSVDDLKVRRHMLNVYVDVEIGVKGCLSLKEAHQIAEYVHHRVEKQFPNVIHCMVHVNPVKEN